MNLTYINSLVFKDPSHKICMLKPHEKNLELKVMIIDKVESAFIKSKQNTLHKFLISDQSGSMYMNLFDKKGEVLRPGDIIYINGAYSSMYKEQMILYEGRQSILLRIGEFFFDFSREPNFSLKNWQAYITK